MADILADGLAFLTKQLAAFASQIVTYSRGTQSARARATFGKKLLKLTDEFGQIRMQWTDLDFCIPSADLPFGEWTGPDNPDRGDLVTITQGTQTQTFEVFPFGTEAPWRWADPHQSMYRIHTKYISTGAFVV